MNGIMRMGWRRSYWIGTGGVSRWLWPPGRTIPDYSRCYSVRSFRDGQGMSSSWSKHEHSHYWYFR
jgi:hypothetical protein